MFFLLHIIFISSKENVSFYGFSFSYYNNPDFKVEVLKLNKKLNKDYI